jgi:serine/threonine protein phosphatase PrpC
MGDKVAHSVGVTAEPDTLEFTLTHDDKFIVIASDGVWEFLSNEDVAQIVLPFYEQNAPEAAANALVKAAFKKWKQVFILNLTLIGRRSNRRHNLRHHLLGSVHGL